MRYSLVLVATAGLLACTPSTPSTAATPERPWRDVSVRALASATEWTPETTALSADIGLDSSQADDSTILALLHYRLTLPAGITVAVLHLPGTLARRWPGTRGDATEMGQGLADSAVRWISQSPRVHRTVILPSMLVGEHPTVAGLREVAARLQADVLLIYRPSCRLYERDPFVGPTQYRGVCTLEAVVLDSRSGVIPFASLATREQVTQHHKGEFAADETVQRVQVEATSLSFGEVASRLATFLSAVPVNDQAP